MKEEDKLEFINLFNEGFEQIVLPHIDELKEEITEIKETLEDHGNRLNRIERKLDAVVSTQDRQDIELKKVKKHLSLA